MKQVNLYIYEVINKNNEIANFFSSYRINKLKTIKNKKLYQFNIEVEYLIKQSIEKYLNTKIDKLKFDLSKNNKPIWYDNKLNINISHSNNYLVVAIAEDNIGVDIEKINIKHQNIAKKIYDDNRYEKYFNDITQIIKDWTIIEAYLKYNDLILKKDFKSLNINELKIEDLYYKSMQINDFIITVVMNDEFETNITCLL